MQNTQLPAEILPMERPFESRHTDAGNALLFSIGADGVLSMTNEVPGLAHGWQRHDLSSARIVRDLPHGKVVRFASARTVGTPKRASAIHLAMVVRDGAGDHLYLSLANSASDLSWSAAPRWLACPFNAGPIPTRLVIAAVRISDAGDRAFVAIDVAVKPDAAPVRFYVDVPEDGPPRWFRHDVPARVAGTVHACCLGRSRVGGHVDGVYLAGQLDGAAQLVYAPLYNPFHTGLPPVARRFEVPGKVAVDALATCRDADNTTDLYVMAQGALYYFSATNQGDGAQALRLGESPLFAGVRTLFVSAAGNCVTAWGLDGAGQVIATSVDQALVAEPSAWSTPAVVLTGAQAIAPHQDRGCSSRALFARTADGVVKLVKSGDTSGWSREEIALAPANEELDTPPVPPASRASRPFVPVPLPVRITHRQAARPSFTAPVLVPTLN